MIENFFKHRREKKEENVIFNLEKSKILRRRRNPKYEIGVSLKSLKFNYPSEIYAISTDDRFLKILRRLAYDKNNLFKQEFDGRTKEFIYMGDEEEDKNATT